MFPDIGIAPLKKKKKKKKLLNFLRAVSLQILGHKQDLILSDSNL